MALYKTRFAWQKWKWANAARRTPFNALYHVNLPPAQTFMRDQKFVVLDCEMSGLDSDKNELLSLGWVQIKQGRIDYGSRRHLLVHAGASVGDSIKIHGLCDRQIAGAASPSKALTLLAQQIESAVLVFHHASLDLAFLRTSAMHSFTCPMIFPYVDTMKIEQKRLERQSRSASLQLNLCRDRYGLPPAFQHNAMHDAVATAELFLAQCAHMASGAGPRLKELLVSIA